MFCIGRVGFPTHGNPPKNPIFPKVEKSSKIL